MTKISIAAKFFDSTVGQLEYYNNSYAFDTETLFGFLWDLFQCWKKFYLEIVIDFISKH